MNGTASIESPIIRKQSSSGMKVRDMVRRYDTAIKTDSLKSSYSSIGPSKSSYFGINTNDPLTENDFEALFAEAQESLKSPSRSSCSSQKTLRRQITSPRFEDLNDLQAIPLNTQKSFLNLSRSRERPRPAPREKRVRNSSVDLGTQYVDEKVSEASYQSKTTISKTTNGVRIIVDIFFDQNKSIAIDDIVGSRIETDMPPSKILKEFQKRVAEISPN